MSSAGINAVNSGPLIIRTALDSSSNNTYLVGRYDFPISTNYVLTTSTNGILRPTNTPVISSLTVSSLLDRDGSAGTPGEVLHTDGSTAYWAPIGAGSGYWSENGSTIYNNNTGGNVLIGDTSLGTSVNISTTFVVRPLYPSYDAAVKVELGGANLNIYKSTVNGGNATFINNTGNGELVLGTLTPSIFIEGGGNVGIGTSSPNATLEVSYQQPAVNDVFLVSSSANAFSVKSSGNLSIYDNNPTNFGNSLSFRKTFNYGASNPGELGYVDFFGTNSNLSSVRGAYIIAKQVNTASTFTPADLEFWTATSSIEAQQMTITSNGSVGIGLTPSYFSTLQVAAGQTGLSGIAANSADVNTIIGAYTDATGLSNVGSVQVTSNNATFNPYTLALNPRGGPIFLGSTTQTVYSRAQISCSSIIDVSTINGAIYPPVDDALWSGTLGGNIYNDNSGNVGIGTATPSQKLEVDGTVYISTGGLISNWNSFGNIKLLGGSFENAMFIQDGQNTTPGTVPPYNGYFLGVSENLALNASTFFIGRLDNGIAQPTKSIYLTQTGNVGIGTSTPAAKLQVAGTLSTLQIYDNNGSLGISGQVLTAGTGGQVVWGSGGGGGGATLVTLTGTGYYTVPGTSSNTYEIQYTLMGGGGGGGGGATRPLGGGGGGGGGSGSIMSGIFLSAGGAIIEYEIGIGGTGGGTSGGSGISGGAGGYSKITAYTLGTVSAPGGSGGQGADATFTAGGAGGNGGYGGGGGGSGDDAGTPGSGGNGTMGDYSNGFTATVGTGGGGAPHQIANGGSGGVPQTPASYGGGGGGGGIGGGNGGQTNGSSPGAGLLGAGGGGGSGNDDPNVSGASSQPGANGGNGYTQLIITQIN